MRRLHELLYLQPGELGRAWPFFGLYLVLFAAFTLADGVSLALFVERAGAASLPLAYAVTAGASLVLVGGYVLVAERVGGRVLFELILVGSVAVYGAAWAHLRWLDGGPGWYGALFVCREVAFTLLLMHFGTYLQDFFTRDQLNRVLPVVYAGGRVGGILGGWLLARLSGWVGTLDAVPVFLGMCLAGLAALGVIARAVRPVPAVADEPALTDALVPQEEAVSSLGGFLRFAWSSRLLFWLSVSSVLFMVARWFLNYRYNEFFEAHFEGPDAMAAFLGRYTQVALFGSLLIQLFVVNRLVARLGVGGAYLGYAALVFGGALLCAAPLTLAGAVTARVLETELRLGLRNPLVQILTNQFSKPLRLRVRAWTMGLLTPLGTGLASAALAGLGWWATAAWVGWAGAAVSLAFLASAWAVRRSLARLPAPPPARAEDRRVRPAG